MILSNFDSITVEVNCFSSAWTTENMYYETHTIRSTIQRISFQEVTDLVKSVIFSLIFISISHFRHIKKRDYVLTTITPFLRYTYIYLFVLLR